MRRNLLAYLALALVLALLVLVLLSWLLSATTSSGTRSLLSAEGIRFFLGGFVKMLSRPLLVWLLLLAMAWGSLRHSGILQVGAIANRRHRRQAVLLIVVFLVVFTGLLLWLTATPQAVLLSATGQLWPSPFSHALVPVVALGVILLSTIYGFMSRRFLSLADICDALCRGIAQAAPLFLLYVLAFQLLGALRFVFS